MKHIFELSDGVTTRQCYFKKITMEDGLKIISSADGVAKQDEVSVNKFINIAIKYLVLIIPETNTEQHIKTLIELDGIFNNPFLTLKIAEEFEAYISPFLESLNLSKNKIAVLQNQAL